MTYYTTVLDPMLDWFERLAPNSLGEVMTFYAAQARFKDPFNDVTGHDAILAIYRHMFVALDSPRFQIRSRLGDATQAFAVWDMDFTYRGASYRIHGSSYFRFGDDGRVMLHRDYWDAAEEVWQQIPGFGAIVRWLRGRFATPQA